ncbi:MAG: histidinol-phosphatase HisJ family protein [Defluviitaleaceae bacterium]|nr:histidinol-phosphatase HisJ family protein [Defluviitaleaceae bacterium]
MHFDAHVHSAVSPDSDMPADVAINTLKRKGLGVIFTEHCDFMTQTEGKDPTATDAPRIANDFIVNFERYHAEYRPLRSDSVLMGLEFTLSAAFLPLNTKTSEGDYDFIVGAVHTVDGLDLYHEGKNRNAQDITRRYLTYAKEMVELCGFFDSFAHIDYICRYAPRVTHWLRYEEFPEEFDALLKALAEREKAFEINTARFGDANVERALFPIYRRFAQLGGKFVTIGSDAHRPQGLGRHFDKANRMTNEAGLTPVYYKERKRVVA